MIETASFRVHSGFPSLKALKSSPGETSNIPATTSKVTLKNFKQISLPLAAVATLLLPFFNKPVIAVDSVTTAPTVEPRVELGPPPSDFGLGYKDFYSDAAKVIIPAF